jgi:hypothetical protein
MRVRGLGWAFALVTLGVFATGTARAQYYYPYGYGGWGWGGWNSIGNVYSNYARGLGWWAAGQGVYNLDTAEANSINVDTMMRLNEYMYESLLIKDRQHWEAQQKEIQDRRDALSGTQDRIRNNPTPNDVDSGDALNLALDELMDPRYAYQVSQVAEGVKIDSDVIRSIPFRNAVEAVTLGLDELTDADQPEIFLGPEFADDVKAYQKVTDELNKEVDADKRVKPETVRQMREILTRVDQKLKGMKDLDDQKRFDAERHLKTLLGLTYMLEGPSIDVYLADVAKVDSVSLAKLLVFMQSFNLRFGVAENPAQKQAYATLYPVLVGTRDKIFRSGTGTLPLNAPKLSDRADRAKGYFSGMRSDEAHPHATRSKAGGSNR